MNTNEVPSVFLQNLPGGEERIRRFSEMPLRSDQMNGGRLPLSFRCGIRKGSLQTVGMAQVVTEA